MLLTMCTIQQSDFQQIQFKKQGRFSKQIIFFSASEMLLFPFDIHQIVAQHNVFNIVVYSKQSLHTSTNNCNCLYNNEHPLCFPLHREQQDGYIKDISRKVKRIITTYPDLTTSVNICASLGGNIRHYLSSQYISLHYHI